MVREDDAIEYHASQPAGKIAITATKPCLTQRDLSLAYTPGVAVPCMAIHEDPDLVYKYTAKANLVAVVTNGTAVLGLGNIGPAAGKPVMEGKAVLFKRFADIDVFDIELAADRAADVIRACQMLEPTFGGINLEDIKAPECFEIEEALKKTLKIPVFHDDQHGTAIIAGAALVNGVEIARKDIGAVRVVINGAGAAAVACARHFIRLGVQKANILMCDSKGVLYEGREEGLNPYKALFLTRTQARTLTDALKDADVFLGLSSANCVTGGMLKGMAAHPLVLALANPDPEIPYAEAMSARPDAIVASGRSDYPNQVNNVLGFPAIFRGALDARATSVNEQMMMAATMSIASLAKENVPDSVCRIYDGEDLRFGAHYIIPKPFDPRVVLREAPAVLQAAMDSGIARLKIDIDEYRRGLENRLGSDPGVTRLLMQKARHKPCRVVFPEGDNRTVLRACRTLLDEGIATPLLLGNRKTIEELAAEVHLDLSKVEIAEIENHPRLSFYVEELYRLRQRKGVTRNEAEQLVRNPNLFGALLVRLNEADALVTGLTTHYSDAVRPLLEVIPLRPGVSRASGLYLVVTATRNKLYFFADCTVNIDPSSEDLAEIALCAADTARRFDVEPRVAFLSFSNFGSSRHAASDKVRRAVEILRSKSTDLVADGEMQADTAVLPERLDGTYPFSSLKGEANILVFPNLDSGNIAYKLLASLGGSQVIGPILMGPARPVHVLQRDASVSDVVNLAALAAVEAQEIPSKHSAESRLMRRLLKVGAGEPNGKNGA
jgi:malate dehydrogenase (oxaloacetate-decarboxylating)(NADP+)